MTEQERAAASAENYRRMRAELDRRLSLDPELRKLSKKIRNGKANFNDTFRYSEIVSKYLGEIMQENIGTITNPLGKEYVCKELLRDHYEAINDVLGEVQVALDEELGIHLNPVKAPRNDERIAQVAHALEDPTVKPETIRRRAKAPVVNTAMSMHDDYIRVNAKLRNDLGLKPIIQRFGTGCCSWCSAVAGKWRFGEQPDDVFRRHDNCDCVIIYDTQVLRGVKTQDGGRSKTWTEVDPSGLQTDPPKVFSQAEAEQLQEIAVSRLTLAGERDIIEARGSDAMFRRKKEGKIEPMPKKQFQRIVKRFKAQGGIFQFDEETDHYLDSRNAEAITYDAKTILIQQNPGRASVFEELIHTAQYRNGRNDGSLKSRLLCEIEAQEKLIRNANAYKLTKPEIEQTKKALAAYQKELEAYFKNGGE